jgi:hypothetical protein
MSARAHVPSRSVLILPLALALSTSPAVEPAVPEGGDYTVGPHVIGAGMSRLQGGSWTLEGTAGQADAAILAGGSISLDGGFWSATQAGAAGDRIFQSGFD